MAAVPLILTLALNPEAEAFFTNLRQQHFPPDRNFLEAHLTLFHQLPPHEPRIINDIKQICMAQPPFPLQVTAVVGTGRGVAYKLESATLQQLYKQWQQLWQSWLIPQDQHRLWPHITVQNKVATQTTQLLLAELRDVFQPFTVQAKGLRLWEYLNGPWRLVQTFSFRALQ